jgi:hypothetical protein
VHKFANLVPSEVTDTGMFIMIQSARQEFNLPFSVMLRQTLGYAGFDVCPTRVTNQFSPAETLNACQFARAIPRFTPSTVT